MDEETKSAVLSCIEESMRSERLAGMKIDLTGTNDKGEGYLADFIFATVSGINQENEHREIHLAVKIGKRHKAFRESLPIFTEFYLRETYFYEKVIPTIREFQLEKNIVNPIDVFPKCYQTFSSDNLEALVLENLKEKGFALHDKRKSMNMQHLHIVLKNYAKFHALSFALRDQNMEKFNTLTSNYDSVLKKMIPSMNSSRDDKVQRKLREAGRDDLAAKYDKKIDRGKATILLEILDETVPESVITHGDCHNNNFLFKYEDNDEENPLGVAIIDWQISSVHSPVLDLSYFLYCAASKENLSQLDVLLKFYHFHLTDFMRQLGSDAEKIFPYSTLVEHWKKYSLFEFISLTGYLDLLFVEKEDAPSIEDVTELDLGKSFFDVEVKCEELYRDRLIAIVEHFFNFTLT